MGIYGNDQLEQTLVKRCKKRAAELGITLQEYLSFQILQKLDDLKVTSYSAEE